MTTGLAGAISTRLVACLGVALLSGCADFHVPPLHGDAQLVVRVVFDLPAGERAAAQLALDQANTATTGTLGGLRIEPVTLDDTVDGETSPGAAASRLDSVLEDGSVVGMVGPENLQVARREIPVAGRGDLAMLSPGLVDSCLTESHEWCARGEPASLYPKGSRNGSRGQQSFWRVVAVETSDGPAAADYAFTHLERQTAGVLDDGTTYGGVLAAGFARRFQADGGIVARQDHLDPSHPPARETLLQQWSERHVDVVYLGGRSAPLAASVAAAVQGTAVRLMVADGVASQGPAALGAQGAGVYGISLRPDPLHSDPDLTRSLAARVPGGIVTGAELDAYLATRVLVTAIQRATDAVAGQAAGVPTRAYVTSQLALKTSYFVSDAYGVISFTPTGDDNNQVVSVWEDNGTRWSFLDQVSFSG